MGGNDVSKQLANSVFQKKLLDDEDKKNTPKKWKELANSATRKFENFRDSVKLRHFRA